MFGRGGSSRDREIIKLKLVTLARKGPGGWWRIAKNVARYLVRVQEIPISMEAWEELFRTGWLHRYHHRRDSRGGRPDLRPTPWVAGRISETGRNSGSTCGSTQMRTRLGPAGPRGLVLLAVAGLAGVLLAVHGWSTRGSSTALGSIGASVHGSAQSSVRPSHSSPSATAAPAPSSGTSSGTTGPLLSSQSFASYSFQVWPGKPSQAARTALTGLSVTVHRQGTGISVVAGVIGQAAGAPHYYPTGARVYVIEASLGDESGNTDYNLGDDGIIVTDAHGRIVQ